MFGLCVTFSEPAPRMLADHPRRLLSVVGGSSNNGGRCRAEVVVIGGIHHCGDMDTSGIRSQVVARQYQQEAAGGWIECFGLRAIVGALIIHLAAAIAVAAVYV